LPARQEVGGEEAAEDGARAVEAARHAPPVDADGGEGGDQVGEAQERQPPPEPRLADQRRRPPGLALERCGRARGEGAHATSLEGRPTAPALGAAASLAAPRPSSASSSSALAWEPGAAVQSSSP